MLSFTDPGHPDRDVVVTGIGLVTPLGLSREATWQKLLEGASALRDLRTDEIDDAGLLAELTGMPPMGGPVNHAAVRRNLRESGLLRHTVRSLQDVWLAEPVAAMSLLALTEAVADAGLSLPLAVPFRSGCSFGASKGGLRSVQRLLNRDRNLSAATSAADCDGRGVGSAVLHGTGSRAAAYPDRGTREASDALFRTDTSDIAGDQWWYGIQTDSATRAIAAVAFPRAMLSCPVAACATGLISVLHAAAAIHSGQCDLCVAGSADASLRAAVLASFHRLRVASRQSPPATACRPFDQHRDGFLVGEGAAVLILESRSHAAQRGILPWARVTAGGWLNDPTGITQIDQSGAIVSEVLRRTLSSVCLPDQNRSGNIARSVDFISAHGTATQSNDLAEARGIRAAFAEVPAIPPCFGSKGATGHLLGAAGGVETAFTLMALHDSCIPGTTGLTVPDPRCQIPLVYTPDCGRALQRGVKLSLGFGGHVACGIFDAEHERRPPRSRRI